MKTGDTMDNRITALIFVLFYCGLLLPGCAFVTDAFQDTPVQGETVLDSGPLREQSRQPEEAAAAQSYLIDGFEIFLQNPELPTGCEITALTMALCFYGFDADKTTMASRYLPQSPANLYVGEDGRLYGSDLNEYFIGDPFSTSGITCGTGAIAGAANAYLRDCGSEIAAEDLTGASPSELYMLVAQDIPVIVWVTIGMRERGDLEGWYTQNGEYVDWGPNDHGAVLIGYTDNTVVLADPIYGQMEYNRETFEEVFALRGSQCVILRD